MTLAVAVLVSTTICAPHLLRLERCSPTVAATIWLAALALRGVSALLCAVFVVLYLPTTELFSLITHWCWHAVIPFIAAHVPLNGHALTDAALIAPAFVLAVSTLSVAVGLWRAARRVRQLLAAAVVGPGPRESLLLADATVLVAAAGLRKPRVVVSAGALLNLDDEELAASLDHEHGHIVRRHRYVLVAAELSRALARFVPGTRTAIQELTFHIERDADDYAVAQRHDPRALASAICKAARGRGSAAVAMALGGSVVTRRIGLLLDADGAPRPAHNLPLRLLAFTMVTMAIAGVGALPAAAHAGLHQASSVPTVEHCTN